MDVANEIKKYLDGLNIDEENISVSILEKALKKHLGTEIKIKINWEKTFNLNETTGVKSDIVEKIQDLELWWVENISDFDIQSQYTSKFIKYNLKNEN